jgi:hypothetical protein
MMNNIFSMSCGDETSIIIQSQYSCFGVHYTNKSICSGRGICIGNDLCSCGNGFTGEECQFTSCFGKQSNDPSVCSSKGTCSQKDVCNCLNLFGGKNCEIDYTQNTKTIVYAVGKNDVNFLLIQNQVWALG